MAIPEEVKTLADECSNKHPTDIDKAVKCWMSEVVELPRFSKWQLELIEQAGRHMIADSRHAKNVAIRKQAKMYGGPAKVLSGKTTAKIILLSKFDYSLGGTRLGSLYFSELLDIADEQEGKANGFMFNADLCRLLYKKKPKKDIKVEDGVTEKVLENLFKTLGK